MLPRTETNEDCLSIDLDVSPSDPCAAIAGSRLAPLARTRAPPVGFFGGSLGKTETVGRPSRGERESASS